MAIFVIERNFAEQLKIEEFDMPGMLTIADEEEVRWLTTFLSADRKKSYCIFEAADPDALRRHAARVGIPADVIIQVDEFNPAAFA